MIYRLGFYGFVALLWLGVGCMVYALFLVGAQVVYWLHAAQWVPL